MVAIFKKRKKFGEIAVEKGLITKRQLAQALAEQRESQSRGRIQKKIGSILLEKGFIEISEIAEVLEQQKNSTFWSWLGAFFSLKGGI